MTLRRMKREEYKLFVDYLSQTARSKPYCPIYEKDIEIDGGSYTLFIQPGAHNTICLLYVLSSSRAGGEGDYHLILNNTVLAGFMETLLYLSRTVPLPKDA